jgi:Tol biopolymer transport system component
MRKGEHGVKLNTNMMFVLPAMAVLAILIGCGSQQQTQTVVSPSEWPTLTGDYLGQKTPGSTPELFAPGIISTGDFEFKAVFSPSGNDLYFVRSNPAYSKWTIFYSSKENGQWSVPKVAPFSGRYNDFYPSFSPDGQELFFSSSRPVGEESDTGAVRYRTFKVTKTADGWTEPQLILGEGYNPAIGPNRELYYGHSRDLYVSQLKDGSYQPGKKMSTRINGNTYDNLPFVAPDGSYLLFVAAERPDSKGKMDLYISFKKKNGQWANAVSLGDSINTPFIESNPVVTPDGKYLLFTSDRVPKVSYPEKALTYDETMALINGPRNGSPDVYWVSTDIFDELRPKE